MSDTLIKVEGLHKKFCQSLKRSMLYGTIDATKSMLGLPIENIDLRKKEFWALKDVNFELKQGEKVGFLGVNGSGKSTLLRLLNGIFPPDAGKIMVRGKIGALIAVGAGFHPQMTGRENIYLNGTILGMARKEIDRKFEEIVDFAEIGEFIDAPVATYSSGMTVRLGFSIAVHGNVDIMLVDEILAVGDLAFQLKCQKKLSEFRQNGGTFIIVSHNMQVIRFTCDRVLWLEKGKIINDGNVFNICNDYENYAIQIDKNQVVDNSKGILNYDPLTRIIVKIVDNNNNECDTISSGDTLKIELKFDFLRNVIKPIFTVSILSEDGIVITEAYSINDFEFLVGQGKVEFRIDHFAVKPQIYYISVTLSEIEILNKLEWHNNKYSIAVKGNLNTPINQGLIYFYPKYRIII
jgi:lipopolysaccharide transport system ATP-binding protein